MKDFSERISALSPEQRALFEARLKKQGLPQPEAQTIPRRKKTASNLYPTSVDQERLWFIEQLQPGNSAYNIFSASRLKGPVDARIMERVVNEIVARHEALRTTLTTVDGQPMQVVAPSIYIPLITVDLEPLVEHEREPEALRLTTEAFALPFDLERAPLVRFGLLKLAQDDYVFYVNMHHTITDRWSGAIFEEEMGALYPAFATGQPSPLPELPIQYADYAVWQRERMQSEVYRREAAYWKQRLAGAPFVLENPPDFPRPPLQSFRGRRVYTTYPKRLLNALREVSRRENVTMFMLLMAAFKTLLYRYTSQEDILIASTFANRNRPELQNLIGYLLNLLVFRTDLSGNPTFRELLARERDTALGAFAHQEMPFGKLVQELRPKQDASRNPIVQASLIYLDFPELTVVDLLGMTAKHLDIDNGSSRFDITLAITETPSGFEVDIEFPTALYKPARMQRMATHLEVLLEGIVADAGQRLSELPILTGIERQHLLADWNITASVYPRDMCLHQLFEEQVERTPDAVAVVFEQECLSYRELNARANRLARHLRTSGVGAGSLVGLLLERSTEMVVGVLGILKAGGAYVPLDASYPPQRLAFMLKDAAVPVLLTEQHLLERLPVRAEHAVCVDVEREDIARQPTGNLPNTTDAQYPAYVIYTSGSTGQPKGVEIPHRAAVNLLASMRDEPGLTPDDAMLAHTTLSFDVAAVEIFLPLMAGARIVLVSREVASDGAELLERLSRATIMQATPATYRLLLEAGWQGSEGLKVFCGGEAYSQELAKQLYERSSVFWSKYGPTETAVFATSYKVEDIEKPLCIGRPLANTQLYVLDAYMNPVPVGIDGELFIGGDGLAHGYLNRPALTAERFVPDCFGGTPGARLYRTGDRVRYLDDGNVEFQGRIDEQVKVRGFRIETAEIEAALHSHEAVTQVVVVAREDTPGDKRLVAYLVAATTEQQPAPTTSELRHLLKQSLPDYMIPSAFVFLRRLPLTPTGKVDRRALPAPDVTRPELEGAYIAPQTPTEERLSQIWDEILGLKQVGIRDDFFDLGGDSLLATQVVSHVRKVFGVELPLRIVFQKPTVSELAASIEELLVEQMESLSDAEAEQLLESEF